MKNAWVLICGALLAIPVWADEPAEEGPIEEAAPAEEAAPPTEEPAPEPVAEEAPAEEPTEEVAEEEPREPFHVYGGIERADLEVSFSAQDLKDQFGGIDFGSHFYRARVGTRVFDAIGLEVQYGQADDMGEGPGEVEVDSYWGVFAVPTGTFLDMLEISVPLGYSMMTLARGNASHDFDRVGFGLNVELPIRAFAEAVPDLRIGGGGLVYQAENDARVYGFHLGVRLDLEI